MCSLQAEKRGRRASRQSEAERVTGRKEKGRERKKTKTTTTKKKTLNNNIGGKASRSRSSLSVPLECMAHLKVDSCQRRCRESEKERGGGHRKEKDTAAIYRYLPPWCNSYGVCRIRVQMLEGKLSQR